MKLQIDFELTFCLLNSLRCRLLTAVCSKLSFYFSTMPVMVRRMKRPGAQQAKGKKGKKGAAPRSAIAKLAQEKLKAKQEEEERIRLEEEKIRKEEEEAERIRLEEERVKREAEELKKKAKRDKIEELKNAGKWMTAK